MEFKKKVLVRCYTRYEESLGILKGIKKILEGRDYKLNKLTYENETGKLEIIFCGHCLFAKAGLKAYKSSKDAMNRDLINYHPRISWGIYRSDEQRREEEITAFIVAQHTGGIIWDFEKEEEKKQGRRIEEQEDQEELIDYCIYQCLPKSLKVIQE